MNKNAKAWVKALESGKYKQGRGALHQTKEDRMCCLGVLCDLYVKSGGDVEVLVGEERVEYNGSAEGLPKVVMEWAGVRSEHGDYGGASLAEKNDHGASFKQIANIIKSEPKGLFA